ncbi:hypothetical protein NDU88_003691 [Pleurodeles waltl]|uniref:Uncharacterized protein n=1 Tax=Pleurodeles waltl TaxID=8319 RepID=A0AAV7V351_PLEWA|nr:hypothetical protein NDU88_003691 [Pleurodeles waltl]
MMAHDKQDRPQVQGPTDTLSSSKPLPTSVNPIELTLASHSRRFNEILAAVLVNNIMLKLKIDAPQIDIGHMRENHQKLKGCLDTVESTVASLRPTVTDTDSCIKALQSDVDQLQKRAEV